MIGYTSQWCKTLYHATLNISGSPVGLSAHMQDCNFYFKVNYAFMRNLQMTRKPWTTNEGQRQQKAI